MRPLLHRLRTGLTTLPRWRDGLELLLAAALLAAIVGPIGLATGLVRWEPRPIQPGAIAGVFFIPALGEELIFRGPWIPDRGETTGAARPILWTTIAFSLWHILETTWLPRAAAQDGAGEAQEHSPGEEVGPAEQRRRPRQPGGLQNVP